jgi:hypothetical protein
MEKIYSWPVSNQGSRGGARDSAPSGPRETPLKLPWSSSSRVKFSQNRGMAAQEAIERARKAAGRVVFLICMRRPRVRA